jgi:hypothetical protein
MKDELVLHVLYLKKGSTLFLLYGTWICVSS